MQIFFSVWCVLPTIPNTMMIMRMDGINDAVDDDDADDQLLLSKAIIIMNMYGPGTKNVHFWPINKCNIDV